MGVVGSLLGTAGGAGGTGFSTPQNLNIPSPVSQTQANTAYQQSQDALAQQQAFVQALQSQNGIQNQSNVFNQLQGVANGIGPNPAQAMLAQATGANVANQAALMAGQRGASQNVGLIARQAAQTGAQAQQQAAGQGATMQANQSLAALGQLGGIAGQQVGQQQAATNAATQAQQNQQQTLLNAIAANQATRAGLQSNINSTNAGLAGTQMQGQQALLGGLMNSSGGASSMMGGGAAAAAAEGGKVNDLPKYYAGQLVQAGQYADPSADPNNPFNQNAATIPAIPVPMAPAAPTTVKPTQQKPASYKDNTATPNFGNAGANALYKGVSSFGQFISNKASSPTASSDDSSPRLPGEATNPIEQQQAEPQGLANNPDVKDALMDFHDKDTEPAVYEQDAREGLAKGGKVPAMVSPGEQYLAPKDLEKVKQGAHPLSVGEKIPGKPKFKGNDYRNDTVRKDLQEGGVVIPNSITEQPKSVKDKKAEKFVSQYLANGGKISGMVIFASKKAKNK